LPLAHQFTTAALEAKNTHAVDEIARLTWRAHAEGKLDDAEAEAIGEALAGRRRAFSIGMGLSAPKPVFARPGLNTRRSRSPDRQRSLERRRRQAMSGIVPARIAAHFTQGENAVLTVIGRQCQRGGACTLPLDAIAALAGVCRTTAQNALRAARARGLIHIKERRIPRRRSLTNVIAVVSSDWKGWLRLGNIGFKNMSPTGDKIRREGESAPLRGNLLGQKDRPFRPEGASRGGAGANVRAEIKNSGNSRSLAWRRE
jgi:hypothetical protein